MIKRQRGNNRFFAFVQAVFNPFFCLQHIGADIAMTEDGTFCQTGRAACILQQGSIVTCQLDWFERICCTLLQGRLKSDGIWNAVFRHHFFHFADDKVQQRALNHAEHLADRRDNHMFDLRTRQHQLQRIGKVLQHDNRGRTAVFQLMLQLARRIKRIGIHCHQTCLQNTEKRNRILQNVRHHNRHTLAARQFQYVLQVRRKIGRQLAHFGISQRFAHVLKSRFIREFLNTLTEYVADGAVLRNIDFRVYALFVAFEPEFFHIDQSFI